jgi:hypothetical protein
VPSNPPRSNDLATRAPGLLPPDFLARLFQPIKTAFSFPQGARRHSRRLKGGVLRDTHEFDVPNRVIYSLLNGRQPIESLRLEYAIFVGVPNILPNILGFGGDPWWYWGKYPDNPPTIEASLFRGVK